MLFMVGIHAGRSCKVMGVEWRQEYNISQSYGMIHFATFPSCAGAERAKRLIFAMRALHRTAVPSQPLY